MPEMDGLELCEHLKSNLDYSHIPIILLTAKTTLESKIEGLNKERTHILRNLFL